jgi:hypothetical protein
MERRCDVGTTLFVSLVLTGVGALCAFDIGGYASRNYMNAREPTWGKRISSPRWLPKPYKIVGWMFLLTGAPLLLLTVLAFIATLTR